MNTMPFGKYEGRPLTAIPLNYLRWLVTETDIDGDLLDAVEEEIERRGPQRRPRTEPPRLRIPALASPDVARQIVAAGRRTLARTQHPDLGGDPDEMKRVNVTADFLEERLASVFAEGGAS